jgi:hypothetical protein
MNATGWNKGIEMPHESRYNGPRAKGCSGGLDSIVNDCGCRKPAHRSWYKEMGQVNTTCRQWFTYGNYVDEVLSRNEHPYGLILAMQYYAHDHLYSPAALASGTGFTVLERYEYDAYGKVTITGRGADSTWYTADDVTLSASAYNNPFTFTSRQLDILDNGNLRIIYYGDRYYACDLGRWISMYTGNESGRGVNPYWYALMMNHYDDLVASAKSNLLAVNGATSCDRSTGKPKIENFNQGVTRQCTQDHEERHAKQIGSCCDKYASKRKTSSKAQQAEDDRAWGNWINNNRKVFECIAHKDSLRCGLDFQRQGCWTKAQSDEIDDYVKNARNQMDENCTGKGGSYTACPF